MVKKENKIPVLSDACHNAWNRYCEEIWDKNDSLRQSFEGGFNESLNWAHKELVWVLSAQSRKEIIERIKKVQNDIEKYIIV